MNGNYDEKTTEKLIKLYNNAISEYTSENYKLKKELIDSKATLDINYNLIYNYKMGSEKEQGQIIDLINKSKNILKKIELLMLNKKNIEIRIFKLKELIEYIPIQINVELNNLQNNNNITKNEISKKENQIKKLKQDLEKTRKNCLFKEARTEVYVIEPTKKNIDKNDELIDAKNILGKVIEKHSNTKKFANKLKKELKKLRNILNELKNKVPKDFEQLVFKLNYNILVEKEEEEIEEEEKEESEEDDDEENGKITKKKEKEYSQLKEKYNLLKKEYEISQKNINEYKKIYRKINEKINNIEETINNKKNMNL